MTSSPDFLRDRLATFIPSRLWMSVLVTAVVGAVYLFRPDPGTLGFLGAAVATAIAGLVYRALFQRGHLQLTAWLFAPLDFVIFTVAVSLTGWTLGGLFIFHMWSVISAGVILGPVMAVVFGGLSILVALIGFVLRPLDATPLLTFELFHSLGVVVVSWFTFVLVRRLNATVVEQRRLRQLVERDRDRLELVVARRTEELVQANQALKNLNVMLTLQRRQAEEANRLKGQFLSSMSHELRTPLNAINGFADLMAQGIYGPVTPRQKERLQTIMGRARDLLGLINNVIDLARVDAGRLELHEQEIDPVEVVREVAETVAGVIQDRGEAVTLEIKLPDRPLRLTTDPERYKQILLNLVHNALKFTEVGRVIIALREGADDTVITEVADTGIGIRPEDLERIFEPFRQVEGGPTRRFGGMGLGLYICRQLVGLLRGSLQVQSVAEEGSIFTLTLPRQPLRDRPEASLEVRSVPERLPGQAEGPGETGAAEAAAGTGLELAWRQFHGIFERSPLPMCIYDRDGQVLLWNRVWEARIEQAGVKPGPHHLREVVPPELADEVRTLLDDVFRDRTVRLDWRWRGPGGNKAALPGIHYAVLLESGSVLCAVAILLGTGETADAGTAPESPARGGVSDSIDHGDVTGGGTSRRARAPRCGDGDQPGSEVGPPAHVPEGREE